MPGLPNARINFSEIMQAVQDKILADGIIADASQCTWATPDNVPQLSGPFDVLLIARNGNHTPYDGGAGQLMMQRHLDIWYRAQAITDSGGGLKEFVKATFAAGDSIIASVGHDNWWPTNTDGELLTIESVKLAGDVPPARPNNAGAFGDFVATLWVLYFPKINPQTMP